MHKPKHLTNFLSISLWLFLSFFSLSHPFTNTYTHPLTHNHTPTSTHSHPHPHTHTHTHPHTHSHPHVHTHPHTPNFEMSAMGLAHQKLLFVITPRVKLNHKSAAIVKNQIRDASTLTFCRSTRWTNITHLEKNVSSFKTQKARTVLLALTLGLKPTSLGPQGSSGD